MHKSKTRSIIVTIIAILLVVGCVGGVIALLKIPKSNKEENKNGFYVLVNGDKIEDYGRGYIVTGSEPLVLEVYSKNDLTTDDFSYKIVPKKGVNFTLTVDNKTIDFNQLSVFKGFDVSVDETTITVSTSGWDGMLAKQFGTTNISYDLEVLKTFNGIFTMVITSGDQSISVDFNVPTCYVELDVTEVIF